MMSTYFGKSTIVLKFPFTSAASAKGEQRYRGLPFGVWRLGEGGRDGPLAPPGEWGAPGVGDRRCRGLRLRPVNIGVYRRMDSASDREVADVGWDKNGTDNLATSAKRGHGLMPLFFEHEDSAYTVCVCQLREPALFFTRFQVLRDEHPI